MSTSAHEVVRPAVILHVEENLILWQTVRDVLEFAGWYVRRFESGHGLAHVGSRQHFDLLIIDRDLRNGSDGPALVRRARQLPHRRSARPRSSSSRSKAARTRRARRARTRSCVSRTT